MTDEITGNEHQNTPNAGDLEAQLAADEAARKAEPVEPQQDDSQESKGEEPQETKEPEQESDEFEKRIARLAYEKRTAEKAARALQERLDRLEGRAAALPADQETALLIERRAAELAEIKAFNAKADAIFHKGVAEFPDFKECIASFQELGGLSNALIEAADEIGDSHKIIHWLAKNPDEAERIFALPQHRMGAALGKVAVKASTPRPISKAPPPIKPITGNGRLELSDEKMPIDEYMEKETERWANRKRR